MSTDTTKAVTPADIFGGLDDNWTDAVGAAEQGYNIWGEPLYPGDEAWRGNIPAWEHGFSFGGEVDDWHAQSRTGARTGRGGFGGTMGGGLGLLAVMAIGGVAAAYGLAKLAK